MKVKISKSVEGGPYEEVVLDKKLVDALFEYNEANKVFLYLHNRGILSDEVKTHIGEVLESSKSIFKEYGLDKYDVRANYLFDKSELIQ